MKAGFHGLKKVRNVILEVSSVPDYHKQWWKDMCCLVFSEHIHTVKITSLSFYT